MRTIRFRAKRKDNNEWHEGTSLIAVRAATDPDDTPPSNWFIPAKTVFISRNSGGNITKIYRKDEKEPIYYEVHSETIGQFTDTYDKNNKPIFENDIIKYQWDDKNVYMKIVFFAGEFRAIPLSSSSDYWDLRLTSMSTEFEVVGNIYDNPELIVLGEEL